MKKGLLFLIIFIFCLQICVFADVNKKDITGRWAEKISERVVMDVYPYNNDGEYSVFITWREDNLAQKDIYRFRAKLNDKGVLEYKDGVHILRFFDKDKYEDKTVYTDGSGIITIFENSLLWTDDKDKTETSFIRANKDLTKDTTVKNRLFSFTLPEETKGLYETRINKDTIAVFDKASKEAGFGGFAFGIRAYKNPADHATLPGSLKLGELVNKSILKKQGILYDMVLKLPTDVQYDYTKYSDAPDSYNLLFELGEWVNIKGINRAEYFKAQGTKGKDLYGEVLKKYITAVKEKWDSEKLETEGMSYMYNILSQTNENALDKIGYVYYDTNFDGIDELLIGEIADGEWKGVIYDIYTMVNRKPKHVVSGGTRDRYFVCNDAFICNDYSSGAMESGTRIYILVENSTELFPQVCFKYDGYENPDKPWFLSYGSDLNNNKWENVSEEFFNLRKKNFKVYKRFDFIPLSSVKF